MPGPQPRVPAVPLYCVLLAAARRFFRSAVFRSLLRIAAIRFSILRFSIFLSFAAAFFSSSVISFSICGSGAIAVAVLGFLIFGSGIQVGAAIELGTVIEVKISDGAGCGGMTGKNDCACTDCPFVL